MTVGTARNGRPPQDSANARAFWRAAGLILLFNGLLVGVVLFKPISDATLALVVNAAQFVGPLLVVPLCFGGLLRRMWGRGTSQAPVESAVTRGRRWAPVLLGVGILSWVLGQAIFTYYEWVLGQPPPLPSIADVGYLSVYPFLLLGILLLPARPIPVASRTRIALDGLMIMTAAVTFSWYFILGPVMQQGSETILAKAVSSAYPLADIVLIACLIILASRPEEHNLLPAVSLLAIGLTLIVVADSNFAYWSLHDTYATGTLPDVGWSLGYMLVGLGAFAARLAPSQEARAAGEPGDTPSSASTLSEQRGVWTSLLPYVLVPAVGVLIVYAWRHSGGASSLDSGVYIGGALLIGLMLFRQVLAILENARLYNRLQRTHRQVEHKNDQLVRSEGELRQQKEYFEALVLNSPVAIAIMDLDEKVVSWNPAAERLFGYSQDEAVGRSIDELVAGTQKMHAEVLKYTRQLSSNNRVDTVTRRSRKDGTLVDVELLAVPVSVGEDQVGTYAMYHDISELKRAEEEVRQLNKDLERRVAERTEQLKSAMAKQQEEAQQRERIEQELRVARLIQQTFLPRSAPELGSYQIASYYRPAREVSGDFYDFLELEDGRLGLVVGDASGKGIPAAMVMANTRSVLRTIAQGGDIAPGQVLEEANEILYPDIPPNMFVTCFYAILDPNTGSLTYANAGHDLPYLHRNGDAEELRARGMPLGLMPGMSYEEREVVVDAGESVLFYSDGLVEAHDPQGEMFGFPRLRALVAEHDEEEHSLVDFLLEELYSFVAEGWEQEDDITLVTLGKFGGTVTAPSSGAQRMISELSMPSEPGNERQATEEVARAVSGLGLPERTLERLKTAVAEATMNAMEHGNRYDPDVPVKIQVWLLEESLLVRIIDRGGSPPPSPNATEVPDLEAKLAGMQTPRGWGLFLIKNMVDEVRVSGNPDHHTVELVMFLKGEDDAG
jgi:PAS domain S-box-containing protein